MSIPFYMMLARGLNRLFVTKSAAAFENDEAVGEDHLERNMTLFDLLCIGVGGTLGSGVFVLSGFIVSEYAGPAAVLSILIAGCACLFSAASYGELASRIPAAGSTYAYAYYALGEYPAVLAAFALTLEYGVSAAAVARSWGSKLALYISTNNDPITLPADDTPSPRNMYGINYFAAMIAFICVCILLAGKDVGKTTVNAITMFKICLVLFMIITGFSLYQSSNLVPFAPFGISGILAGATQSFFGFVGFDEVCCLAAEVKNPHKVMPVAVFGTIIIVTILSSLAALALAGTKPYTDISVADGFANACQYRGLEWASQIVSIGEIISLPLVVLVSFLAQPRLQYALAKDGLMPKVFCELNSKGNLTKSIFMTGIVVVLIALFIPFSYLNAMISAGVLCSFNLSNSAIIMVRRGSITFNGLKVSDWHPCSWYLIAYHAVALILAFFIAALIIDSASSANIAVVTVLLFVELCLALTIYFRCPENPDPDSEGQYRVAWMPFLPLIGIIINFMLIAQLQPLGLILIVSYFAVATFYYFVYCVGRKSALEVVDEKELMHNGSITELPLLTLSGKPLEVASPKMKVEERKVEEEAKAADSGSDSGSARVTGEGEKVESEFPLLKVDSDSSERVPPLKEEGKAASGSVPLTREEGEEEEEEELALTDTTRSKVELHPGLENDGWRNDTEQ